MEKKRSKKGSVHGIADVTPEQLDTRIGQITKHLDAIDVLLFDARALQNEARKRAVRLRGDDEVAALSGVIEFAALRPQLFTALADEDEGVDPDMFETKLLADRLANAQTLATLADRVEVLHQTVADTALYTVTLVKPPVLAAYEIAKPYRMRDPQGALLNDAVNFYRGAAQKGAKTKRAASAATAK